MEMAFMRPTLAWGESGPQEHRTALPLPSADAGAAMEVGAIAVAAGGGATLIGNFPYASVNLGGNTLQKDGSSRDVFVLAVDAAGTHVTPERFGDALAQTGSGIVTIGTTTFAAINHAGKVMFNGGAEADSVGVSNAVVGKLTTPALISRATGAGVITLRSIAAADVSGGVVAISEARS